MVDDGSHLESSSRLAFATVNEHLCMQVAAKVLPTAKTELSEDGNVLVVHRFDVDENGKPFHALEDFCAVLGLRPAQKYDTTWERIAKKGDMPTSTIRRMRWWG